MNVLLRQVTVHRNHRWSEDRGVGSWGLGRGGGKGGGGREE